jgi:ABC-2 type transport system permease protein
MLNTIFLKTLFEKRWMTLWWTIGGMALIILIVLFFPTLRDSLGASLNDVPESMRNVLGDAAAYQTLGGYVELQVFEQMVFLPIILGIILCTGLLAGEENEGTLQTLLSYPVSRSRVYAHKLAASLIILGIVSVGTMVIGTLLGAAFIGESISILGLIKATAMAWLVGALFATAGYALGAATGKRGLAGGIAGGLAFATFLIGSLAAGVDALKYVDYLSPFHYYNTSGVLETSFPWGGAALLLGASVACAAVGYFRFIKRDIYPR